MVRDCRGWWGTVETYFWHYCSVTRTIDFPPCIRPYRTSPALLKIPPCVPLIPFFLVIAFVRSTYFSRSLIVDSQGILALSIQDN